MALLGSVNAAKLNPVFNSRKMALAQNGTLFDEAPSVSTSTLFGDGLEGSGDGSEAARVARRPAAGGLDFNSLIK